MPKKPNKLTDLAFSEVSLVDAPANPGARVVMFKSGSKPAGSDGDQNEGTDPMADEAKKIADLEKSIADLKKANEDTAAKLEKAEAAKAEAETIAKMSTGEREHLATLKGDDRAAFLAMTPAKRRKAAAEAAEDEEVLKVEGVEIRKSVIGDAQFAIIKSQQARLDKQAEDIAKANEKAELATLKKRADDEFSHVPGSTDDRAAMLKAVAGMTEPLRKSFEAVFVQSQKLAKAAFARVGHGGGNADEASAIGKLDSLAKARAKEKTISFEKAYDEVTRENPALYREALAK